MSQDGRPTRPASTQNPAPRSALVVGGGIVGISTAYCLARRGLDVTLLEEHTDLAGGATAANAGWLLHGTASVLPSWSALKQAAGKSLGTSSWSFPFFRARPLALAADAENFLPWLVRCARSCLDGGEPARKGVLNALASFSVDAVFQTAHREGIEPGSVALSRCGTLSVSSTRSDAEETVRARSHLAIRESLPAHGAAGRAFILRSREEVEAAEPGVRSLAFPVTAGTLSPGDAVGDCRAFALRLAEAASRRYGVQVEAGKRVSSLHAAGGRVHSVTTSDGSVYAADAVVVCAGSRVCALARPLGERTPVYPVLGYSVTVPWRVGHAAAAGRECPPPPPALSRGLKLSQLELHITPVRGLLRFASVGELAGPSPAQPSAAVVGDLLSAVRRVFPAADVAQASVAVGARPVCADGLPIVSRARRFRNLFFNVGHGTLGWTLSMGTALLCSDLVCGARDCPMSADPLSIRRFDSALYSFLYPPTAP